MRPVRSAVVRYSLAIAIGALAVGIRLSLLPWLGTQLPFVTFFAAIAAAAWYAGTGPAVATSALLYAAANYLLYEPRYALSINVSALLGLAVYAVASGAIVAAIRLIRLRRAREQALLTRALASERSARVELEQRKETEQRLRQTEARLGQEIEDLARLYGLSSRLESLPSLDDQLHAILESAADIHGSRRGLAALHEPGTGALRAAASIGFDEAELPVVARISPGAGASGRAFAECRRIAIADTAEDPQFSSFAALSAGGSRAVHSVPLIGATEQVLGALSVHLADARLPTEREMQQMDLLARKAAIYVERARAESGRRELEHRLMEADRRKDEFLATLAHELRNPLAPIRNAARFLQLKGPKDPDLENARGVIERQVGHMARLVDDLLDVSRVTLGQIHLQKEVASVAFVIASAVEATRPLLDAAQHDFAYTLPAEPVYVDADVTRLTQVLQNLLGNAAKYTPAGGRIRLDTETVGGHVHINVRDNGRGIAPDMLGSVFELFTRARASDAQGGLGIGLSLAQRLARMHDGRIVAHSAGEGRGSVFTVVLPTCAPPAGLAASPYSSAEAPATRPRRVLVVDDNADAAESLRLVLALHGHDAVAVHDGEAALHRGRQLAPDVVLLDLGMPKLDGYAVCLLMRAEPWGARARIVALTGWGQPDDRARTAAAGFDEHLVKPVDPRVVERLVAEGEDEERRVPRAS